MYAYGRVVVVFGEWGGEKGWDSCGGGGDGWGGCGQVVRKEGVCVCVMGAVIWWGGSCGWVVVVSYGI